MEALDEEEKVQQILSKDLKLARQLYMSEEKDVRKQEFSVKKAGNVGCDLKLPTRMHLLNSQKSMVGKLSQRWQKFRAISQ